MECWRPEPKENLRRLGEIKALLAEKPLPSEEAVAVQRFCRGWLGVGNVDESRSSEDGDVDDDDDKAEAEGQPTFELSRDFQAEVLLRMEIDEGKVVDEVLVRTLERMMGEERPASASDRTFVQACIGKLELSRSKVSVLNVVLGSKALDEASLAFLESLLFKRGCLHLCLTDERLLVRLARLVGDTAFGSEGLNRSSRFGTLILSIAKGLRQAVPKVVLEHLGKAAHAHKSFLRKPCLDQINKRTAL